MNTMFKIPTLFIVYAHDSKNENKQKEMFASLVDHLRRNAINATCDFIESSEHASIHIPTMEYTNLKSDKVIIVLSELYKEKAEHGKGGVSEEYRQISYEINKDEYQDKYIVGYFKSEIGDLSKEIIKKICPDWIAGKEIVDLEDVDELVRIIHGKKKYVLSPVSDRLPGIRPIKPQDYKTLVEKAKRQKNNYGFENLSIFSTTTFYSKNHVKYELNRTIKVLAERLTEMPLKPSGSLKTNDGENALSTGDTILLRSPDFDTIKITIDENKYDIEYESPKSGKGVKINNLDINVKNCSVVFDYPIPNDNQIGDYINIEYSIEFKCKNVFISQEQFKSVNDSHFQKHEIVLEYKRKKDCPPAELSKLDLLPRAAQYAPEKIKLIPYNSRRKSYTVYFENPQIDTLYYLNWKW